MKFIDSVRFMVCSLSTLADNLTERLHRDKCKDYESILEYVMAKDILVFLCVECDKSYDKNFNDI